MSKKNDPVVAVPGYGTMPISVLKKTIKQRIKDLAYKADQDAWNNVCYDLLPNGTSPTVLQTLVKALKDACIQLKGKKKMGESMSLAEMIDDINDAS